MLGASCRSHHIWISAIAYIYIHEESGTNLSDYQIMVELNESNFNYWPEKPLIKVSQSGTLCDYWVESWDHTNKHAKIWIKVPSIPANSTVRLLVGRNFTSTSNGDATFEFFDDFTTDPNTNNKWEIYRYANDTSNEFSWDSANRRVYLTKAAVEKGCMAFFKNINTPLSGFRLRTKGGAGGGTGADGWAFAFFKDRGPYETHGRCYIGSSLGLQAWDGSNAVISSGYAVEFDNYQSGGETSANHNALVDTSVGYPYTHIVRNDTSVANEDNITHEIEILYFGTTVTLRVDGSQHFSGGPASFNTSYSGIGFSAGTGGATNNHWIEDYVILCKYVSPEPTVTVVPSVIG